ncbi:MAG: hypothetical protein LBS69_06975 [Prevotellaceae bacterium]|nr:hypothetical protein [Prevotellaceae bacterium]
MKNNLLLGQKNEVAATDNRMSALQNISCQRAKWLLTDIFECSRYAPKEKQADTPIVSTKRSVAE